MNKTVIFHNEKGNVLPKVRAALKDKAVEKLMTVFPTAVKSPKGLAVHILNDENGDPIYMVIDAVITQSLEVAEKAVKEKVVDEVVIPDIFE